MSNEKGRQDRAPFLSNLRGELDRVFDPFLKRGFRRCADLV
jgi:hypothetical protein